MKNFLQRHGRGFVAGLLLMPVLAFAAIRGEHFVAGFIDASPIGSSTPSTGNFTSLALSGTSIKSIAITHPSRSFGVTYPNSSTWPLSVAVSSYKSGGGCTTTLYVDGAKWTGASSGAISGSSANVANSITAIVPAGSTYSATTDFCTLDTWSEAVHQ